MKTLTILTLTALVSMPVMADTSKLEGAEPKVEETKKDDHIARLKCRKGTVFGPNGKKTVTQPGQECVRGQVKTSDSLARSLFCRKGRTFGRNPRIVIQPGNDCALRG